MKPPGVYTMRRMTGSFVMVFLAVGSLLAQTPKTIHCFTAVQALVTNPPPSLPVALLDVEIPEGGTFVKASLFARPRIAGAVAAWVLCPLSGVCQGVYIPPLSTGAVAPDMKVVHYGALVTAVPNGTTSFNGDTFVRLIVDYTTTETVCKSQNSFQTSANAPGFGLIILPAGKTPTLFSTFGAELVPESVWKPCGTTPNPSQLPQTCNVAGGSFGGLTFELTPFVDESDKVYGVQDLCRNWSNTWRRGCRTIVEYAP
jgi:hypothetical protein